MCSFCRDPKGAGAQLQKLERAQAAKSTAEAVRLQLAQRAGQAGDGARSCNHAGTGGKRPLYMYV